MHDNDGADDGRPLLFNRTAEVVVALLLLAGGSVVMYDSLRIGIGWRDDGPAPGFYPFYVAAVLCVASLVNLAGALRGAGAAEIFVSSRPFLRVLAVLVPSIVYVGLIEYVGIYVASAIFIFAFMMTIGRENPLKALGVGVGVPIALFLMFEKWFLVPLPKGPVEAWLGF